MTADEGRRLKVDHSEHEQDEYDASDHGSQFEIKLCGHCDFSSAVAGEKFSPLLAVQPVRIVPFLLFGSPLVHVVTPKHATKA